MKKRNLIKLGTPTILGMVGVSVAISSCSSAKDNITSVNIKGPSHLTALIGQADNHAAEYLAIDNLGKIVTQEGARWSIQPSQNDATGVSIDESSGVLSIASNATSGTFTVVCTLAGFDIVPQTVELTMASSPLPVTGYTIHGPSTVAATKRVANTSAAEYYAKDSNDKVATTGVWSIDGSSPGISIDQNTGILSIADDAQNSSFNVCYTISGTSVYLSVTVNVNEAPLPPIESYTIHGLTTLTATKGIANNTAAEYYAVDSNGALATGGQWYWSIFESNSNVTINSNTGVLSILNSAESYIFYVIFEIRGFDETFFSQQISLVVSEAPSAPNII